MGAFELNYRILLGITCLGLVACSGEERGDDIITPPRDGGVAQAPRDGGVAPRDGGPSGVALLGNDQHSPDSVNIEVIGTANDGLNTPRDVEANPLDTSELWVVNRTTESVTVFTGVGTGNIQSMLFDDNFSGTHFLAQPAALAFGQPGTWASIHETDQLTQGNATPPDFMGPTLWTSDLADFDGGHSSHLDMLHNSPLGMGIAWDVDNVYWIFDGAHRSITRYDFNEDHDLGGSDHSDGTIRRYVEGMVSRVADVPSHMVLDHTSGYLYVADTGNNRIAMLDTNTGNPGGAMGPNYDGIREQRRMEDAMIMTFVDGMTTGGMELPSGIDLDNGILYVSDHQSSVIFAFSLEGELLDYLLLGRGEGAIMGLDVVDGVLYVVDASRNELLRITPR